MCKSSVAAPIPFMSAFDHLLYVTPSPPSVGLPSKAEGPASEVYRIRDDPANAFGCLGRWWGRRQEREMAAPAPLLLRNRQRFHIMLTWRTALWSRIFLVSSKPSSRQMSEGAWWDQRHISICWGRPRRLSADFTLILLMMLCFVSKHSPNGSGDDQHSGNPNTATI
jgi:hypothetical protein